VRGNGLADPPRGVGGELEAASPVELLHGAHQAEGALLDEIEEGETATAVALRDRHHETEVGLDHLLLGRLVARLDPLGEAYLVGGGEQRHPADVLEEQLQRVGGLLDGRHGATGPLGLLGEFGGLGHRLRLLEQVDARLFQMLVDLFGGLGVEPEGVEDLSDLFHAEEAEFLAADDQLSQLPVTHKPGQFRRAHPPPFPREIPTARDKRRLSVLMSPLVVTRRMRRVVGETGYATALHPVGAGAWAPYEVISTDQGETMV